MADAEPHRPRLVSVGGDAPGAAAEGPAGESSGGRAVWLLALLLVAAILGLVAQGVRVQALRAENAELNGQLFTARTALEAYGARFAEVRQSIGGLQEKIAELEALVSADPLEPAGAVPEPGVAPAPE